MCQNETRPALVKSSDEIEWVIWDCFERRRKRWVPFFFRWRFLFFWASHIWYRTNFRTASPPPSKEKERERAVWECTQNYTLVGSAHYYCTLVVQLQPPLTIFTSYYSKPSLLYTPILETELSWTMEEEEEEEKVQLQLPLSFSPLAERQHVFSHKMLLHLFRGGKIRNGKSLNNYRGRGKFKLAPTLFSHNRAEKRKGFFKKRVEISRW